MRHVLLPIVPGERWTVRSYADAFEFTLIDDTQHCVTNVVFYAVLDNAMLPDEVLAHTFTSMRDKLACR